MAAVHVVVAAVVVVAVVFMADLVIMAAVHVVVADVVVVAVVFMADLVIMAAVHVVVADVVVVIVVLMADLVIMAAVHVVVVAVVVVVVMVPVIHSRCCCTHQSHATSGHPAAPAAMIHELPLLRPQLLAASSVADTTAAAAAADVDPLDPTRLAPQARTKLILDIDISFNKCGDNFHRVKVCERLLGSLQELDEFLPVSAAIPAAAACSQDPLQRRDHQARNENESAAVPGNPITLIQPPLAVEVPTPVVTVAVLEEQPLRVSIVAEVEIGSGIAERFLRDLGKLVLRLLSTKFTLTFSKPDVSERLLKTALKFNILELAKLVVVVEPYRMSNNRCLDSETVVAKVMKCASMVEFITFLFEICQNPLMKLHSRATALVQPNLIQIDLNKFWLLHDSIRDHYSELFATHVGGCDEFSSFCQNVRTDHDNTLEWYSDGFSKTHEVTTSSDEWNLTAQIGGLQAPEKWLKHAEARRSVAVQTVMLQVSLQSAVTGACSIAIGVRNVQVQVVKNAADSDLLHTADHDNSYLSDLIVGLFVPHITVSVRPELERKQVKFMALGLASPNEPRDISAAETTGSSTTFTASKNPGFALTAEKSSSTTIKLTTSDWHHEQTTQGADDEVTGTFCWNLRRLGGVPFNYLQPKRNKVINIRAFPIFERFKRLLAAAATSTSSSSSSSSSLLNLPFNSDGSVTFIEQFPSCKMMKWTLANELAQKDVTWFVTVTVHLTMLNRFTGEGKTLEFRFCDHFKKKMMMMSTDAHVLQCNHTY